MRLLHGPQEGPQGASAFGVSEFPGHLLAEGHRLRRTERGAEKGFQAITRVRGEQQLFEGIQVKVAKVLRWISPPRYVPRG
ncbi:hypothetical protein TJA_23460 [Thermus sp. LT1-2-5]